MNVNFNLKIISGTILHRVVRSAVFAFVLVYACAVMHPLSAQSGSSKPALPSQQPQQLNLTPLQSQIERERERLLSPDGETRRDAVLVLGAMMRPESARVAATALTDSDVKVRAVAARAILGLPSDEAASLLSGLILRDRNEFVRQEAAYAAGETESAQIVPDLISALENDRGAGVRGAAAVSLGLLGDKRAVPALSGALNRRVRASGFLNRLRRRGADENEFVRRSAARSLGQIGGTESVAELITALSNEEAGDDVRREAARSLGSIGDPAAVPALRAALTARDPYLSRIAYEALRRLAPDLATRPAS